ncbi:Non-reducing polyketide synthase curS2 [Kalmusia sp. IMI 367209]|nr:Non-reducing polyketide synthase curS2 [Kalmusia sp. IMI 367209]
MGLNQPTVLLFGDVTDAWVDGMDYVSRQAITTPWLQSFLEDIFSAFKAEVRSMDRFLRESFGDCSSFQELAQNIRHSGDPVGMVHAILLYTVRAALLLKAANCEPLLLNPGEGRPQLHLVGISGGLWNAVTMPTAANFSTLYDACIEAGRVYARLCNLTFVRSRAMEDRPGVWGWAVLDIATDELGRILEKFQNTMGVPSSKRAKIGITGDRWSTVIGPPSVLELVFSQCSELKRLPKNELAGIRAMQHTLDVSEADIDYVVGNSSLLLTPLLPGYKVWGMAGDDANATYSNWGHLLRVAAFQTLSQRLDVVQTVGKLNAYIGTSENIDIKMMGPSSHMTYLVNVLKAGLGTTKRHASVEDDLADQSSRDSVREDAIAVIGMSGKGPCSDDLDEFWNIIATGQDCHQEIPTDRFDLDEYYCTKHGLDGRKCTITCRHGCFIKNPGHFDAKFFHISPREALLMDAGHRLFLMNAYEALETSGYSASQTKSTDPNKMAVFFGQSADDWRNVSHHALGCDAYSMQSIQRAFGPGRLAFQMKWEGPTYALDSACAGATSCIHLACMSLLSRDIDMAVAGATNVLSDPHSFCMTSKAGVLSTTGNCKTYRDDADGYCRADFSGAVVLKRLEDAISHNDKILAVIASTGRNHSGNSTSITTSDANAQERLFNKVLRNARMAPNDVSYVEMHGTGTQVGDKAEMEAVTRVFSPRRGGQPLPVGAVKANIGHILKSILMLQKGILPPQAGMPHSMNPNVLKFLQEGSSIVIPTEPTDFKGVADKPKRILVNNFDAAGGNACVILEEYKQHPADKTEDPRLTHVISASARTQSSYLANMRRLAGWLRKNPDAQIQDTAYSTTARRVHHPIRFALTASTSQEAISKLEAEIDRISAESVSTKSTSPDVVFVFTGQGSHYAGMGAELYRTSPVFQRTVDLCVALCASNGFPSFLDIITNNAVDISTRDAAQIQLAVVTLEIALTAFWRSTGIVPAMVMGHSLGEYAALYAAGVLSLNDTLYLVGQRARLLLERCEPNSCAMLSVSASVQTVRDHLSELGDSSCCIACINSPNATVISGSVDDLEQVQAALTAQDPKTRTTNLSVPFAFHSFQMDAILQDYKALASGVTFSPPKIPVASTLLASKIDGSGVFSEEYLIQQTRQAVDFCGGLDAVSSALKNPFWIEIGPGPVCSSFVRATLSPPAAKINHTIDAKASNWASISKTLAMLYTNGADVDWLALHAPYESNLELLPLPTYAWDLKDYWITHTDKNTAVVTDKTHSTALNEPFFTTTTQYLVEKALSPRIHVTFRAGLSEHGFIGLIDGHKMQGIGLASGSVFSDAAAAVAKYVLEYSGRKNVTTSHLTFHDPELLAPLTRDLVGIDGTLFSTATMESASADAVTVTFKAISKSGKSFDLGSMGVKYRNPEQAQANLDRVSFFIKAKLEERIRLSKEGSGHRIQPDVFFALFANAVEFSPDFRGVQEAYVSSDFEEAAATIVLRPDPVGTVFTFSPYWAEALLHLAGFMVNGNPNKSPQSTFVVMGYDSVEQLAAIEPGKQYLTYTRISRWEKNTAYCAGYVFDPQTSKIVMQAVDLRYQEFKTATWRHILDGPHATESQGHSTVSRAHKTVAVETQVHDDSPTSSPGAPVEQQASNEKDGNEVSDAGVFQTIIDCLIKATGSDPSDLTDDAMISDIGVDSIMAIEVVSALEEMGVHLPAGFVFEYPTIGDLRHAFGGQNSKEIDDVISVAPSSEDQDVHSPTPSETARSVTSSLVDVEKELETLAPEAVNDTSPLPSVRITLLQGRRNASKAPLYMMADGTGTVASYLHLRPFESKQTVYGIDSPYFRCPSRMTSEVGIEEVAKLIVEALIKAQETGPFLIGGYSAGCLVAFEVSRQLAAAGRKVDGLLLIDMCCPRSRRTDQRTLLAEDKFSYDVFEAAVNKDGLWSSIGSSRDHFRAFSIAMNMYAPTPLTATERPAKTAVIWAERGLVNRVSDDPVLMQRLEGQGVPTKPYSGFMEDPKFGTFACLVPNKDKELGPNGWEKYTSGDVMALSVDGDHFELPMPSHVHLLQAQMEKAFTYFSSN